MAQSEIRQPARRAALGASVVGVCLLSLLSGCGQTEPRAIDEPPPLVEAVDVQVGGLPLKEIVPGIVRAKNQVTVRGAEPPKDR